jgi:AGCS family alanine or glycine:cation symporter
MYALSKGLNAKRLAIFFCIFTAIAAFGIGNMVQANSIAVMVNETFNISPYITGLVMTVCVGVVILGGIRSIANVCEKLVPFMALFYIIGCLAILILNARVLPETVMLIIKSAFTPQSASGGFIGASVMAAARFGITRGLFSNESGLGSAPIVAAAAQTKNPVKQALVSSTGTFWDTVVVCAMTGLVIVSEGILCPSGLKGLTGAALTQKAFGNLHVLGPVLLTGGLLTFVFSTILGWSYYGERAVEYLMGKSGIKPYRVLWVIAVFIGSVVSLPFVWDFADSMNALMALPNLISLILLNGVIVAETRKYLWNGNIEMTHDLSTYKEKVSATK